MPLLPAKPAVTLKLAGAPSDAQLADVSDDGVSDYLYTDKAGNTLNVLLGNGFSAGSAYPTGVSPEALAIGISTATFPGTSPWPTAAGTRSRSS